MKRRITLYIGGIRADLANDGFILLNYALTDLTNPTIVKNAWTQSVDLPRTAGNDKIFGSAFRLDRNAGDGGTGADFNASKKTAFSIYSELGEVLFSGYCKLEAVTRDAYRVSFFGGLGEFIYGLSYDTAGEKRTLASLDYGEDIEFDITAAAVADAWARLGGDSSKPALWDIINFAPAYNGIPSNFKADKALVDPTLLGLNPNNLHTMDGKQTYSTKGGGYALLNLPEASDEWMAHDFRSYLQRPVLSVRALLNAIADPANNGGWEVDLTDVAGLDLLDTWLTRPLLPSLGTYKQTTGGVTITPQSYTAGSTLVRFALADVPAGTDITARVKCDLRFTAAGASPHTPLRPYHWRNASSYVPSGWEQQIIFVQAVAYASDNTMVAAGPVKSFYKSAADIDPDVLAEKVGYTPKGDGVFAGAAVDHGYALSGGYYFRQRDLEVEVTGANIARIDIEWAVYRAHIHGAMVFSFVQSTALWDDDGNEYTPTDGRATTASGTATGTSGESLRSGAHITKDILLSTSQTPADYLLAICKTFGLYIVAYGAARRVQILSRNTFYNTGITTDLTKRIDKASMEIQPLAFDAKWYEFKHESVGGRFEQEYADTEGVQYGIQRVDTGYDFDAETKDLLQGVALKSCAAVQDRGKWWYYAYDSGTFRMWFGPLMSPGCEYTLWDADGANHEANAEAPTDAATPVPYNPTYPGYDFASRAEFRDADGKPLDGADVLLVYCGDSTSDDYNLTDDTPAMDTLLGGPCWKIEPNNAGLTFPQFTRYYHRGQDPEWLLDFGFAREIDIPGIRLTAALSVYERRWQQFVWDRLSVHGKVLRCKALLDGLQFGPGLLRRFYWYGGSLWVLNKVTNYSLTTFDPAECEFIQVRDTTAYTGGQS